MSTFILLWCFAYYVNFVQSKNPLKTRYYLALVYSILYTIFSFMNRYYNNKIMYHSHTNIQNKILKLLDKQLQILEDEVNLLKFKITHNKMSDSDLEIIYESLVGATNLEEKNGKKKF